jgi:hypothetical protein
MGFPFLFHFFLIQHLRLLRNFFVILPAVWIFTRCIYARSKDAIQFRMWMLCDSCTATQNKYQENQDYCLHRTFLLLNPKIVEDKKPRVKDEKDIGCITKHGPSHALL